MPTERKLPTVTRNRNYPQTAKHLKPTALTWLLPSFPAGKEGKVAGMDADTS
jgi:hypothetical protein